MARKSTEALDFAIDDLLSQYSGRIFTAEAVGTLVLKAIQVAMNAAQLEEVDPDADV